MLKKMSAVLMAITIGAISVIAQDAQIRNLVNGQKYEIKGTVVATEDANTFIVRDSVGVDTRVVLSPNASIRANSFWGSGDRYPAGSIVRGLNLEVEGRGDGTGNLAATKVRFDKSNLQTAQSIDARVAPAEARLTAQEQNAERISGQIDELMSSRVSSRS